MKIITLSNIFRALLLLMAASHWTPASATLVDDNLVFSADYSFYYNLPGYPPNTFYESNGGNIAVGQYGWDGSTTWFLGNAGVSIDGDEVRLTIHGANTGPFDYLFITSSSATFTGAIAIGAPVPATILSVGNHNPGPYSWYTGPGIFIDLTNLAEGNYALKISTVPESSTIAMLITGLCLIVFAAMRQRRAGAPLVTALR